MKPIRLLLLTALSLSFATPQADAEAWPARLLRAIVPLGAGSTTDIVPRVVFEQLSQQLGQTIVVENRTGAGGTIGAAAVAKADPDGYTFLVHSNAHTIAPSLYPNLSYHPARDFAAVISLGTSPNVLVVSPAKGFKTIGDLVAAAKAKPGSMNFSSVGAGTATPLGLVRRACKDLRQPLLFRREDGFRGWRCRRLRDYNVAGHHHVRHGLRL